MKARRIKRLRRKIKKVQDYTIRETVGLFGDFFGNNRMCFVKSDTTISASNPKRAIKIYMKQYRKEHKMRNKHESNSYEETTHDWGHIMVMDESGFMRFYR